MPRGAVCREAGEGAAMTDTTGQRAKELRDTLLHDLHDRRGFKRDSVERHILEEWDQKWLDLITAALAASPVAVWTKDRPTVEGWYWFRPDEPTNEFYILRGVHMVHVTLCGVKLWMKARTLDFWAGSWAGPITPPQE